MRWNASKQRNTAGKSWKDGNKATSSLNPFSEVLTDVLSSWECFKIFTFLERAACPTTYAFFLDSNLLLLHGNLLVLSVSLRMLNFTLPNAVPQRSPLRKLIARICKYLLSTVCTQALGVYGIVTKTEAVPGLPKVTL